MVLVAYKPINPIVLAGLIVMGMHFLQAGCKRATRPGTEEPMITMDFITALFYEPMVLVSDKLSNDIRILQTKLSDREGYEARRVRLEAMPLDQHIEGGHGERQARLKRGPASMHHLFQMADQRQPREHRLHQHTVLPCTTLTQFEVGGIALRGLEAGVTQDHHPSVNVSNEPLKGVIGDMGRRTVPPDHQAILV